MPKILTVRPNHKAKNIKFLPQYISKPYFCPNIQIFSYPVQPFGHFFSLTVFYFFSLLDSTYGISLVFPKSGASNLKRHNLVLVSMSQPFNNLSFQVFCRNQMNLFIILLILSLWLIPSLSSCLLTVYYILSLIGILNSIIQISMERHLKMKASYRLTRWICFFSLLTFALNK